MKFWYNVVFEFIKTEWQQLNMAKLTKSGAVKVNNVKLARNLLKL